MASDLVPYGDLQRMAADVVKAGLFPGIKTPEQALTLFLVAQAEGLHPMTATMRYNIIQNRPAMKAEAMLASFMERGGTVEWTEYTDEAVTGIFKSQGVPKGVTVRWTMQDAKRAGLGSNPTWAKYPKQMLKARVASDGVRMADPAVNQGRYTPEEVSEFEPNGKVAPAEIVAPKASGEPLAMSGPEFVVDPDLTRQLAESLKDAQNKDPEVVADIQAEEDPEFCTCGSTVGLYFSESKAFPGRTYVQCRAAYLERDKHILAGDTVRAANAKVAHHFRAWVGKWPLVTEDA